MAVGIHLHSVEFTYAQSEKPALQDLSLHIPRGSIFGLVGPNGAGKTTLLRHIAGMLTPQHGTVDLDTSFLNHEGSINKNLLSLLLENPGVYKKLSIYEYLHFFAQFYDIDDIETAITLIADKLYIESLSQKMQNLSLGTIQKVHIARCFLKPYSLILLDEPTSNLDPITKEHVWDLINSFNKEFGTTIIICSHQLHELEQHCTDFGFIKNGHIAFQGTSNDILLKDKSLIKVSIQTTLESDQLNQLSDIVGSEVTQTFDALHYECESIASTNTKVLKYLIDHNIEICEVVAEKESIHNLYKALVEC